MDVYKSFTSFYVIWNFCIQKKLSKIQLSFSKVRLTSVRMTDDEEYYKQILMEKCDLTFDKIYLFSSSLWHCKSTKTPSLRYWVYKNGFIVKFTRNLSIDEYIPASLKFLISSLSPENKSDNNIFWSHYGLTSIIHFHVKNF